MSRNKITPSTLECFSMLTENQLNDYIKTISKLSLLEPDEESELAYKMENGDDEARKELVLRNLRLVVAIAKPYRNKGLSF